VKYTRWPEKIPLLSAPWLTGRVISWVTEHAQENWFKFLEDYSRYSKVSLQPIPFVPKLLGQIGHVFPFLHFIEKID